MSTSSRHDLAGTFATLSAALATGADVVTVLADLTADCTRLLSVSSAGLLLADGVGRLHVMATTSSDVRDLEVLQTQTDQRPCLDSFRTGRVVEVADLAAERDRWPIFTSLALDRGLVSVHAVPLRLRERRLGALGLFGRTPGALSDDDSSLGRALADVASVVVAQNSRPPGATEDGATVDAQLHAALAARAAVEQARGVLAHSGPTSLATALDLLRAYSADHGRRLSDVAGDVIHRRLPVRAVLDHTAPADG